jgi:glutamate 5-kinase
MMTEEQTAREALSSARRIVVKIGSRVLVQKTGRPESRRIKSLIKQMVALRREGKEVIFVSSGAVGAGMEALGLTRRPKTLPDLQMAASVGQMRLMSRYDDLFKAERQKIGQVLLTHDDLTNRTRHLNARNALLNLLRHDIIPIVNENDVVSVDEIKVGDNDVLAAMCSVLVEADALLLLTTTNGLRAPTKSGRSSRVKYLPEVSQEAFRLVFGKHDEISTGGMATKLEAAQMASSVGSKVVIADGKKPGIIKSVMSGESEGTLIATAQSDTTGVPARKKWIAYFHRSQGTIVIDKGAQAALVAKQTSLLPVGIHKVDGRFSKGALLNIRDKNGKLIAKGLSSYGSEELRLIKGKRTKEIATILGTSFYEEAVHRDNLVLL